MESAPTCPRCKQELTPPSLWSNEWECPVHGAVPPVHRPPTASADWMLHVCASSRVPVWMPWPLPEAWVVSDVVPVGDRVRGITAVATVLTGPSPLGGPAEMLIVSEEPGVGFAAGTVGLDGTDPGAVVSTSPYTQVDIDDHPVPLWLVPDRRDEAAVVGERDLIWLWIVLRPATAGAMLVDRLAFADARGLGEEVRLLPYGARSTWLNPS
mgnify:CR=1 FL=1